MTPAQRNMLKVLVAASPEPGLRSDSGNWSFGDKSTLRSLLGRGWARDVCGRVSVTEAGVEAYTKAVTEGETWD